MKEHSEINASEGGRWLKCAKSGGWGIRQVRRSAGNNLDEKDGKNNEGTVSEKDMV